MVLLSRISGVKVEACNEAWGPWMAVSEGRRAPAAVMVALAAGLALLLGGAEAANAQSSTPR